MHRKAIRFLDILFYAYVLVLVNSKDSETEIYSIYRYTYSILDSFKAFANNNSKVITFYRSFYVILERPESSVH